MFVNKLSFLFFCGIFVFVVSFFFMRRRKSGVYFFFIGLTAAATFAILDVFSPSIGSGSYFVFLPKSNISSIIGIAFGFSIKCFQHIFLLSGYNTSGSKNTSIGFEWQWRILSRFISFSFYQCMYHQTRTSGFRSSIRENAVIRANVGYWLG